MHAALLLDNMEVDSSHLDVLVTEGISGAAVLRSILFPCPLVYTAVQALHSGPEADHALAGENPPGAVLKEIRALL